MYQALYRKWRPKVFSDVIGQPHITETLQKQVAEGRTSHAYLFTGTRGTGKTTCAKILAKAINCEHPVNGNPCCKCPSCLGIESGNFLDVLELDAASNNGVDQVRALRDEAIYSPAHVKKRVYIIDEVHMLSPAAFNALLKILEEPPEHLVFILATTEIHKVLPTILSRCQRYSFKRITPQDIASRLSYVAEQEKIDLTPDGAEILSRLADGALRDGLSLLDQCASAGGRIDSAAVLNMLGLAGNLQTAELMDDILRRDAQAALLLLDQMYSNGKDVGAVLSELSILVRDLLICRTAPSGGSVLLSGGYDSATLDRLGKQAPGNRLLYLAETLQKTTAEMYASTNRRTDAELCLIRLCDESLCGNLTALENRIQRLEERLDRGEILRSGTAPAAVRPTVSNQPEKKVLRESAQMPSAAAERERKPAREEPPLPEEPPIREEPGERIFDIPQDARIPAEKPQAAPAEVSTPAIASMPAQQTENKTAGSVPPSVPIGTGWWRTFLETCKNRLSPMYRAFLDMCTGTLAGDVLTVYAPDDITLNRLDNDRVRGVLQEEGETAAGGAVRLILKVGEAPQASPQENLKSLLKFGSQFDNIKIK